MTLANVETKIEICEGRGLHLVKKLATKNDDREAKNCPCNLN